MAAEYIAMYELWDLRSGNVVADFEEKSAALDVVRTLVSDRGADSIEALALVHEDEGGESTPVAEGRALAELAMKGDAAGAKAAASA